MLADSKTNNFYDILRIDPLSTTEDIKDAIRRSRNNDVNNHMKSTIDRIENILLNHSLRIQYHERLNLPALPAMQSSKAVNDDFADIGGESIIKQQLRNLPHHSRDKKKEIEESSVMSSDGQMRLQRQKASKLALMLFLGFCLVLVMFVISKPLLNYYQAISQSKEAMEAIISSQAALDNFMRQEKYFPDRNNINIPSNANFDLRLEPKKQRIVLTFNSNASTHLQGAFITHSYITPPNYSYWRCDISGNYPTRFKPSKCY